MANFTDIFYEKCHFHNSHAVLYARTLGAEHKPNRDHEIMVLHLWPEWQKDQSSTFYIIKQGSAFYVTYDVNGKRLHTFGAASVGEILAVSGDTFTSRQGAWVYTWDKEGKKINTRAAK